MKPEYITFKVDASTCGMVEIEEMLSYGSTEVDITWSFSSSNLIELALTSRFNQKVCISVYDDILIGAITRENSSYRKFRDVLHICSKIKIIPSDFNPVSRNTLLETLSLRDLNNKEIIISEGVMQYTFSPESLIKPLVPLSKVRRMENIHPQDSIGYEVNSATAGAREYLESLLNYLDNAQYSYWLYPLHIALTPKHIENCFKFYDIVYKEILNKE